MVLRLPLHLLRQRRPHPPHLGFTRPLRLPQDPTRPLRPRLLLGHSDGVSDLEWSSDSPYICSASNGPRSEEPRRRAREQIWQRQPSAPPSSRPPPSSTTLRPPLQTKTLNPKIRSQTSPHLPPATSMAEEEEHEPQNDQTTLESPPQQEQPLSKNAQKRLLKQKKNEARKAEKKAQSKEQRKKEVERKRREWEETLAGKTEEEKERLIELRKCLRMERMGQRSEERVKKLQRLAGAKESGQNVVVDLEFGHLMTPNEIHRLVKQVVYCYGMNGRSISPCHLWLTGCSGEMEGLLQKISGFNRWTIEKDNRPYSEALQDHKENLVYLTADSENVLDELDPKKFYIVGGLVDRNRFKGITMKKAEEQGIQTAKLPIGNYLKMSSSQVLTVNQVIEIVLKYLETRDWKTSFFQVIPQRKRCEGASENQEGEEDEDQDKLEPKKQCIESPPTDDNS